MLGPRLKQVATLGRGSAFGEVALQTDQPRSATIRTLENTHFATLDRSNYQRVLRGYLDQQQRERMEFLGKMPLFEMWSPEARAKLSFLLQLKTFKRGERVYDTKSPVLEIFIVRDGEFSARRKSNDDPGESADHPADKHIGEEKEDKEPAAADPLDVGGKAPGGGWVARRKPMWYTVGLLTAPQIFGFEEYIQGDKRHRDRVVCSSTTGSTYTILCNKLVSRLSMPLRQNLLLYARALEQFREERLTVLNAIHEQAIEARGPPRTATEAEREQERRMAAMGKKGSTVYGPEGRLFAISSTLQRTTGNGETEFASELLKEMIASRTRARTARSNDHRNKGALKTASLDDPERLMRSCWGVEGVTGGRQRDVRWLPQESADELSRDRRQRQEAAHWEILDDAWYQNATALDVLHRPKETGAALRHRQRKAPMDHYAMKAESSHHRRSPRRHEGGVQKTTTQHAPTKRPTVAVSLERKESELTPLVPCNAASLKVSEQSQMSHEEATAATNITKPDLQKVEHKDVSVEAVTATPNVAASAPIPASTEHTSPGEASDPSPMCDSTKKVVEEAGTIPHGVEAEDAKGSPHDSFPENWKASVVADELSAVVSAYVGSENIEQREIVFLAFQISNRLAAEKKITQQVKCLKEPVADMGHCSSMDADQPTALVRQGPLSLPPSLRPLYQRTVGKTFEPGKLGYPGPQCSATTVGAPIESTTLFLQKPPKVRSALPWHSPARRIVADLKAVPSSLSLVSTAATSRLCDSSPPSSKKLPKIYSTTSVATVESMHSIPYHGAMLINAPVFEKADELVCETHDETEKRLLVSNFRKRPLELRHVTIQQGILPTLIVQPGGRCDDTLLS